MKAVRHYCKDNSVLMYVSLWLTAGILNHESVYIERPAGTPQGGVISPLRANFFPGCLSVRNFRHLAVKIYDGEPPGTMGAAVWLTYHFLYDFVATHHAADYDEGISRYKRKFKTVIYYLGF